MKFSIKDFFSKCDQETADLVTFTEEILNGKLRFLCSDIKHRQSSYEYHCKIKKIDERDLFFPFYIKIKNKC